MKVLIITYYWPPSGGSGVQRWLKFVKYLQEFGITPVVYTVANPDYAIEDTTLEAKIPKGVEVIREPIWEPYKLANLFSRKKKTKTSAGFLEHKPSFLGKVMTYVRANYFIPDARMFWIKPSVKHLEKYLKKQPVDFIISSGPPHSLHLIGLALKKKLNIPWVSDFRDPWTDIDYFHQLPLSKKAKQKHFDLEKEVLTNSNAVLVVGKTMQQNYLPFNKNTFVVPNGFDIAAVSEKPNLDSQFSLTHIGMMNEDRNPLVLWKVLKELTEEIPSFKKDLEIKLIGKIAQPVLKEIEQKGLSGHLNQIEYLAHSEVQEYQRKSQVLLLAVNNVPSAKGIITGKIFEYLVAKRPILAIGPVDGDLAEILKETDAGTIVDFEDYTSLKRVILDLYKGYQNNSLETKSEGIQKYHRKEITRQLSEILKTIQK
ncbi:glycosyltransferase [Flavicella sediminum]|uniref:glycosyltransferase n=1 Tax=Flavicella sediminum TaxID=2585141 RepID=UPI001122278B|nr:glycosyltransferase [Flavicella sediminum]